ncbi:hypothetical protein QZH41_018995, partial [Actinostola sp. cb2023]
MMMMTLMMEMRNDDDYTTSLGYLHDRHLIFLLAMFLCVDIVILSTWQIIDPLQTTIDRFANV